MPGKELRRQSFGQAAPPSAVDRFGVWLSSRQVRRFVPSFEGLRIADFGCGYDATATRRVLDLVQSAVLVDVALAEDLKAHPKIHGIEGELPAAVGKVPTASLDVVMLLSVLEHLWERELMLQECHRVLAPGGVCLVNVPSWLGKRALEFSAFRLGLSPRDEMDDHKIYFGVRDLWPLLVQAGFLPHNIRCFAHKFGMNVFAVCRIDQERCR